jgi:hypothetical protein
MLDSEYVNRIDREMEQSGGELAPDDHEAVWENLKASCEWGAELEFAIALLTDMSLEEVRKMTLKEAAKRHPTLSQVEALKAEIRIRDSIQRAVHTRKLLDQCARMQREPATPIDLFDDEEDLVNQQQQEEEEEEENETARLAKPDLAEEGEVTLHRTPGDTKPAEAIENNSDVKGRQGPWPDVRQGTGSDQDRHYESTERVECLTDRLTRTTSFDASRAEWLRQRALEKPRPDYGTFLKDEELIELFPEAAATYHADDIRRSLMMIRMILEYGEAAFTLEDGDTVHTLLVCILEQEDYWFDGTWSANNPAERDRNVARPKPMPSLDFDDDDLP